MTGDKIRHAAPSTRVLQDRAIVEGHASGALDCQRRRHEFIDRMEIGLVTKRRKVIVHIAFKTSRT